MSVAKKNVQNLELLNIKLKKLELEGQFKGNSLIGIGSKKNQIYLTGACLAHNISIFE